MRIVVVTLLCFLNCVLHTVHFLNFACTAPLDMRKIGSGRGLVSAYPRQLESLIRLSEAHAKMRFSDTVEIVDVEEAKRLHREALKQSATDPKTGIIDVGILTTGVSASERDRRRELAKELKRMIQVRVHIHNYIICILLVMIVVYN